MALLIGLWTVLTTKVRSRFAAMASGRCRPGTWPIGGPLGQGRHPGRAHSAPWQDETAHGPFQKSLAAHPAARQVRRPAEGRHPLPGRLGAGSEAAQGLTGGRALAGGRPELGQCRGTITTVAVVAAEAEAAG